MYQLKLHILSQQSSTILCTYILFLSFSLPDVLVWSNDHIQQWVREIGLGDHAHCLNETGVHGGVVALDNDLDHEKLALALQVPLSSFEVHVHVQNMNTTYVHVHVCVYMHLMLTCVGGSKVPPVPQIT